MIKLGPALTLYAKYPREMDELCSDNESVSAIETLMPWLKGDSDKDRIVDLIEQVGEMSYLEVKEFLKECTNIIKAHFITMCKFEEIRVKNHWYTSWRIWPKKSKNFKDIEAGISIETEGQNLVAT
jgi:hypothetical protein